MNFIALEVLLVFILLLINGIFSMSELAVVSARRIRLRQSAENGSRGARTALELAESPNKFLSTVQIGITLVGILSGAFGGAGIAQALAFQLEKIPILAPYAAVAGFLLVVVIITYFSIIIGELIPKSIALNSPEKIAALVSRPMKFISFLASPVVWLLSAPTAFVLKLFRVQASVEPPVTDEEIKGLIDVGTKAGVFEEVEQSLIESIILLEDRRIASLMTPRTKISWLNIENSPEKIKNELIHSRYSRLPVGRGNLDALIGYASAKSLLTQFLSNSEINLEAALKQPLYVPETLTTLELLERFKKANTHFAMVIDEFGGIEGLVTMHDVLEAIIGELPNSYQTSFEQEITLLENGAWLASGQLSIIDLKEILGLKEPFFEGRDQFHTVAGFMITRLGKVPEKGEGFEWNNYRFEVIAMDRNRVDKILITPLGLSENENESDD